MWKSINLKTIAKKKKLLWGKYLQWLNRRIKIGVSR
jgi:hypothetical protein